MGHSISDGPDKLGESSTEAGTTLEGAEGALAPPELGGSERRTERETDNLLLLALPESKS